MKSKHVNKTEATKADHYNDLVDDVQSLEVSHESLSRRVAETRVATGPFIAEILTEAADGEYSAWQEVYRNTDNDGWEAMPGGRTHDTTNESVYEFSGKEGVSVGSGTEPVWVFPSNDSDGVRRYMFVSNLPTCIYAKLTSESAGAYGWAEWDNDFTDVKTGGLTSAITGFNASLDGLTGLPRPTATDAYNTKVIIFPRPPSDAPAETVWQALMVHETDIADLTRRLVGDETTGFDDSTAIVEDVTEWDIEGQQGADKVGANISYMSRLYYQHPISETSGKISTAFHQAIVDVGGRMVASKPQASTVFATVKPCPPIPVSVANDIAGVYT